MVNSAITADPHIDKRSSFKKILFAFIILGLVLILIFFVFLNEKPNKSNTHSLNEHVPGQLIVIFKNSVSEVDSENILKAVGCKKVEKMFAGALFCDFGSIDDKQLNQYIVELNKDKSIEDASYNRINNNDFPNDPNGPQ